MTIKGKDEGVYTFVEEPNENYVQRYFGDTDATIYKPKVVIIDAENNTIMLPKDANRF